MCKLQFTFALGHPAGKWWSTSFTFPQKEAKPSYQEHSFLCHYEMDSNSSPATFWLHYCGWNIGACWGCLEWVSAWILGRRSSLQSVSLLSISLFTVFFFVVFLSWCYQTVHTPPHTFFFPVYISFSLAVSVPLAWAGVDGELHKVFMLGTMTHCRAHPSVDRTNHRSTSNFKMAHALEKKGFGCLFGVILFTLESSLSPRCRRIPNSYLSSIKSLTAHHEPLFALVLGGSKPNLLFTSRT
jgi:hypothetical protein